MWTRAQLKERAKADVKRSYWGLVLVSFAFAFVSTNAGGTTGSGGSSSSYSDNAMADYVAELENEVGSINWEVIAAVALVVIILLLIGAVVGLVLGVFVLNPLQVGLTRYFIEATYAPKTVSDMNVVRVGFKKGSYMNVVKIMFLKSLYQWLWSLLFVIPGIVKTYEYQMIPYILAENPTVSSKDAFQLTKEMMNGEKMNTFELDLSFMGWILLSLCTCGLLAIFYVSPYINMTKAHLYEVLKHRATNPYFDRTLQRAGYGNPGAYSANNPYQQTSDYSAQDYSQQNSYDSQDYSQQDSYNTQDEAYKSYDPYERK